jgi:hypothetical protein
MIEYDEIAENVKAAGLLMIQTFPEDMPAAEKISILEDHLLDTARWRGAMEGVRVMLEDDYEEIDDLWRDVTGWEVYLNGKPKSREDIDEAKRQVDRDLFARRRTSIKLMRQCRMQINRLERDDAAVSRAYTMMTGS